MFLREIYIVRLSKHWSNVTWSFCTFVVLIKRVSLRINIPCAFGMIAIILAPNASFCPSVCLTFLFKRLIYAENYMKEKTRGFT